MLCNVFQEIDALTSPKFAVAFSSGCGGIISHKYESGSWAGFASPKNWYDIQKAKNSGHDFYYGDHAYFGRMQFYRITKNAYQHNGDGQSDCLRFKRYGIDIRPWRNGSHILICPQSDIFFQLLGIDKRRWLFDTIAEIKKHTDREIIIREKGDTKPFLRHLQNAHCVVVYSSNAAVESVVHGVPAICLADCAASIMGTNKISDIENLPKPDNRLMWAGVLADNQWTFYEMKSGMAWGKLNEKV